MVQEYTYTQKNPEWKTTLKFSTKKEGWNDIVCNKDKFISQVRLQGNPKLNAIIKLLKKEK